MSHKKAFLCGVPDQFCSGGVKAIENIVAKRGHSSSEEAFRCKKNYLVQQLGYTQIGAREFRPPDGGPVLVLTKKSRYGGVVRRGKEDRLMLDKRQPPIY